MRVLWFTNYPSLASDALNEQAELRDWVAQLEKSITQYSSLKLALAFHYSGKTKNFFTRGETSYYALPRPVTRNKIKRYADRLMHRTENESEKELKNYLEIISLFAPDIIHVFGTEQPFGLISDMVKTPVIINIQGNLTVIRRKWFSGLSNFDILKYSSLLNIIRATGLWHEYFYLRSKALREQKIFKITKYFVGRTAWDKRITDALSDNAHYYHCDELLRKEFYRDVWQKISHEKLILVTIIGPDTYKGLETILETSYLLKSRYKSTVEWNLVGVSGDEELVSMIQKKVKRKLYGSGIFLRGALTAGDVRKTMLESDIYIHASHIENSSNSICEAMMLGMPIIATYAGGTPSMLIDGLEGMLVQDGDAYALTGAIIEAVADWRVTQTMAANARKRALERHNPAKVVS